MKAFKHQVDGAEEAYKILKQFGIVYLAWEERCGKTITSIIIAEISKAKNILVLTKKKALEGWNETLENFEHLKKYTVTNYHQAGKLKDEYDLIILDEAHSYLSAYPKPGKIWKDVFKLTRWKPIIYMSATPYAQGYQLLFNQFRLSSYSPWKNYKNFYEWHRVFGIPDKIRTPYGLTETYKSVKDTAYLTSKHLFHTRTRKELDFEHEPEDVLHYVELSDWTKKIYNEAIKKEMLIIPELGIESPLDSPMKLRTTLHMLEGGVAKVDDNYYILPNEEKINAIKEKFGDRPEVVIMYNYIAEGEKLKRHFRRATILQGTSFAEGVDLSWASDLIIYSQDFSTARHSQRRARQANKNRATEIRVSFYLCKGAVSEQVYNTVSKNKRNFIDALFDRKELK